LPNGVGYDFVKFDLSVPWVNRCGLLSLIALDRGWGKAAQALETGDNGTFELVPPHRAPHCPS
jgi:hypothetical protein